MIGSEAFERYQVIHVRGGAFTALDYALNKWFEDHLQSLAPKACFKLCKLTRGNHMVLLSRDISYLHFFKVLHYINRLGKKTFNGKAVGYTYLPKHDKIPDELSGEWVMGIVPEFEADFNFSIIVSQQGKAYRCSRYGKIRSTDFDATFRPLDFDPSTLKAASVINEEKFRRSSNHPTNNILPKKSERSFFFLLLLAGGLLSKVFSTEPRVHTLGLSVSLGLFLLSVLWIYFDIRILRNKRLYVAMTLVSLLTALVSKAWLPSPDTLFPYLMTSILSVPLTLFLLLTPRPWKFPLKDLFKLESIENDRVHSVDDFAYMTFLITVVSGVIMVLVNA